MRRALTALAVFAFIAACSSHYDLVTPAGADAGTADAAAAPTTDGSVPADDDGATAVDAASGGDGGLPEPPAIGSNCLVGRNPVPLACQDFDNDSGDIGGPSDGPHQINGTATVGAGSNSTQGLVCSAAAGYIGGGLQGAAYYDTQPSGDNTQFVWSFDLLVNSALLADTAVTALQDFVNDTGTTCELDIVTAATGFTALSDCEGNPETLFNLAVPFAAAGSWMSVLVAIDLNASTLRLAVRPDATSAPLEASGAFRQLVPNVPEVMCGAWRTAGGTPSTVVAIDNIAVWWK